MPLKLPLPDATPPPARLLHSVTFNPVAQVLTFANRDERLDNAQSALANAHAHLRGLYAERSQWLSYAQSHMLTELQWLASEIDTKGLSAQQALMALQAQQSAWTQLRGDAQADAHTLSHGMEKLREKLNSYDWQHRLHKSLCEQLALMNEQYEKLPSIACNVYRERIDAAQRKVSKYSARVHSIKEESSDLPDELSTCATLFEAEEMDVVLVSTALSEQGLHADGTGSPLVTWMDAMPELDVDDWRFILSHDENLPLPPIFAPMPQEDCAQLLAGDMGADAAQLGYFGAMH